MAPTSRLPQAERRTPTSPLLINHCGKYPWPCFGPEAKGWGAQDAQLPLWARAPGASTGKSRSDFTPASAAAAQGQTATSRPPGAVCQPGNTLGRASGQRPKAGGRNRALLLPPPPLLQSGVSCAAAAAASPPHKAKWTPDAHLAPCLSLGIPLAVLGARGKGWGIFSCSISCNVCSSGVVNISLYFSPPSSLPFHLFVVVHCSFVRSFSPVKFPDHHLYTRSFFSQTAKVL